MPKKAKETPKIANLSDSDDDEDDFRKPAKKKGRGRKRTLPAARNADERKKRQTIHNSMANLQCNHKQ